MLANQLPVPEIQVRQEPAKANEIKSSRDNTRTRDFQRDMENGRREQQDYQNSQDSNKRQADGKEANVTREPKGGIDRTEQRRDHKKRDRVEEPVTETEVKTKTADGSEPTEEKSKPEHDCEHEIEKKVTGGPVTPGKISVDLEQGLEAAEQSETSKWLDTILSLASETEADPEAVDVDTTSLDKELSKVEVDLSIVKQILASLGSETELPELEGQQQISLADLESVLNESEMKALLAQLNKPEMSSEQEFEQLLAQLNPPTQAPSESKATEIDQSAKTKPLAELIAQIQSPQDAKTAETKQAEQVINTEKTGELKLTQAPSIQADKIVFDKQENKFKQSSLMSAMQLSNTSSEGLETEVEAKNGEVQSKDATKQTIADILTPTTKVVNISGAPSGSAEVTSSLVNNVTGAAAQAATEQSQLTKTLAPTEQDLSEIMNKDTSENKLASLLGTLAPEEVKTSDLASRAEKVNVAGVTLDKTLQMPKIENMNQARNEVVVRENILFNKQELATQMQTQVGMMMARNMKSVDIRLDPPELGSMQVKLSIQNEQASVSFIVSNQQTKDALENSFPKLKELLEQQGLQLADSDVQQQQSQAQGGSEDDEQGIAQNGLNSERSAEEDELEQQQQMINRAINSPWNVSYYA